jgi:glutamyl-tRNA reductase
MLTIGASHRTTRVTVLGEMSRAAHDLKGRLREGGARGLDLPVAELAVLSTCGRVEVYAVADASEARAVSEILAREVFGASVPLAPRGAEEGSAPYFLEGELVARHLCRVAAGLDSMVPGEHEIAGQVARAFEDVVVRSGRGGMLTGMAALARKASRRIHAATNVGRHPASIGSVVAELTRERLGDLTARSAVVIGAGAAGLSAARALRGFGVGGVTLVGRSRARTREAAREIGAAAAPRGHLMELMSCADVVIAAAGSDGPIVDVVTAKRLANERLGRGSLLIIDLAVPPDVDPRVERVPGIELLGLDDVKERVSRYVSLRREELAPAEEVIDEIMRELDRTERRAHDLIGALRRSVEEVRAGEVARWLDTRDGDGAPTREELDSLTRSLVNKVLHDPMIRLRAAAPRSETGRALLDAASELFGLAGDAATHASGQGE